MTKHCSTCKCADQEKKIRKNFDRLRHKYQEVDGTFYDKGTKREVITALEDALKRKVVVVIADGFTEEYPPIKQESDRSIGEDWLNEGWAIGRVGRTMGPLHCPILVERGEHGGPLISSASTVRIIEQKSGRVLYQHPKYKQPKLTMGPVDNVGGHKFQEAVYADGKMQAQFHKKGEAQKWAKEFGWTISS